MKYLKLFIDFRALEVDNFVLILMHPRYQINNPYYMPSCIYTSGIQMVFT